MPPPSPCQLDRPFLLQLREDLLNQLRARGWHLLHQVRQREAPHLFQHGPAHQFTLGWSRAGRIDLALEPPVTRPQYAEEEVPPGHDLRWRLERYVVPCVVRRLPV